MTAALLTYTSNPTQVAISASGSTSTVGITFLIVNKSSTSLSIQQIVLTIPQGDGSTDLIAAKTTFSTGSVHSSNGSPWSLTPATNQAVLTPVSSQGFAALAPGDSLQFTLSGLQINASGAGQSANIAVLESIYNGGDGSTQIPVQKIAPGFYIESFYLDQYNVASGSPVTVTWKVVNALSCSVTAQIIQVASAVAERSGLGCGVGTANPVCDGPISTGTDFSDSHTCNVQGATVFTLTAQGKGAGGDATLSSQLLVTVNEPATRLDCFPPGPSKGQTVKLSWVAADAGKLQLYTVPSEGQQSILDVTDTPVSSKIVQPLLNTNYFLYAFTSPGDSQPATHSEVDITVYPPQWTTNFAASNVPSPAYPGDEVTLNWAVANVDYCNLTCDQPGFAPQNNLKPAGPWQVKLPDPGTASATATFTLTPVQYGGLGNFTPQTTQVPITNLPHFSQNLAANPPSVAPGGSTTLTWALDHADTAVLASDLPGARSSMSHTAMAATTTPHRTTRAARNAMCGRVPVARRHCQ